MEKKIYFNHEKLEVYQYLLQFIKWLNPLWKQIYKNRNIADQLDRASISVLLNIAEGNGKSYPKERKRFFKISKASALECAFCLDVIRVKNIIKKENVIEGIFLLSMVKMITKLSQSTMNHVRDEETVYVVNEL